MSPVSRRSVLAGSLASAAVAGLPVGTWLGREAAAQTTHVRYSATSPRGEAMLEKYARAVALMKDQRTRPIGDPRSWTFQWYTHWLPPGGSYSQSSQQKQAKINALPPQYRAQANAMWNSCQAHNFNPSTPDQYQEWFFLPWHRLYVYYLEQIVQATLQDADFSLPYWNYLSGNLADLSIPAPFRDRASPLYRANRNPWVNAGERIDKQNPGAMNLNAMRDLRYINSPTGGVGFCPVLDGNPHGLVHVFVGDTTNMGSVPYAAEDPIFWLHHCQIDRIWDSWNVLPGRRNPSWPNRNFAFARGSGQPVSAPVASANSVADLNYRYDSHIAPPRVSERLEATAAEPADMAPTIQPLAAAVGPVALSGGPVRRVLTAPAAGAMTPLAERLTGERRYHVILGGLLADAPPGITYNVYLDLPEGAAPSGVDHPHYAGTFGFFGAVGMADHGLDHGHDIALDVSDTLNRLRQDNLLQAQTTVTIVPAGIPSASAQPLVRRMELIES